MATVGIDIGTTSISVMALDEGSGEVLEVESAPNRAAMPSRQGFERLQDPQVILRQVRELLRQVISRQGPPSAIGVTGQMHGILYADSEGRAVSPLYTWQDGRGGLPIQGEESFCSSLAVRTGYPALATGYGSVTHYYNRANGLVPGDAASLCTIGDYIVMDLCGLHRPVMHASNAAGLGVYSLWAGDFDRPALERAGLDPALFPQVEAEPAVLGESGEGAAVSTAIGDNQASFLGSVGDLAGSILVNAGTGGQISVLSPLVPVEEGLIELRPFVGEGQYLLVGSSLCAGRSYALLESFFAQVLQAFGGGAVDDAQLYQRMNELALEYLERDDIPQVSPLFLGTRQNPDLRGEISGLGLDNFTPRHLIVGLQRGIIAEYRQLFDAMNLPRDRSFSQIICSGNGLRKNAALQRMLSQAFNLPIAFPSSREEACRGAALSALRASGKVAGPNK